MFGRTEILLLLSVLLAPALLQGKFSKSVWDREVLPVLKTNVGTVTPIDGRVLYFFSKDPCMADAAIVQAFGRLGQRADLNQLFKDAQASISGFRAGQACKRPGFLLSTR